MNKETNKLLADFLRITVDWSQGYDCWFITTEYGGIEQFWNPDSDWNQLIRVIDKLKPMWKNESYSYEVYQLMDTPIGNSIQVIYEKVVTLVKLLMDESPINPE